MPATLQLFQWFVQFEDGFIFAQFDPSGKERQFKEFAPDSSWKDTPEGRAFDIAQNHWAELEKMHGRIKKAGWLPFTKEQRELYQQDSTIRIELLQDPHPIMIDISEGWYPYLKKQVQIDYGLESGETLDCKVSDIYLGQIRKSDQEVGEMYHFNLNVSQQKTESIPA